MEPRSISVLHVEDDPIEQRVMAHRLDNLADLQCDVTTATTEADALRCFDDGSFDLVVLDYQLAAGDGLNLLRQVRARDALIPVIAISGVATSEIALELIQSGADDYFQKGEILPEPLTESIRVALRRTESVRKRSSHVDQPNDEQLEQQIYEMCNSYGVATATRVVRLLDAAETACRLFNCAIPQLEQAFVSVCSQLDAEGAYGEDAAHHAVHPLLLELSDRLASREPLDAALDPATTTAGSTR